MWWHNAPDLIAVDWFFKTYGMDRWNYLVRQSNVRIKANALFYEMAIDRLKALSAESS